MTSRHRRLATIVLAPVAALAAWGAYSLGGLELVLKSGETVGPFEVAAAAVAGSVAGWLVLRLIERRNARPRATWSFVGSTALAVSIIGPTWLADGSTAVALITLHVVTAVVVIVGLAGTVPIRRPEADAGRAPPDARRVAG